MLQMAFWKSRRFVAPFLFSLLLSPALAQQAPATGSDAKSYTQFGMANGAKGDLEAAIAAFNQAITIDPGYAPAYYFRAFGHSQQKKYAEAINDYNHAIQIDPKYTDAYYQRGCLKGQQGDFDGAIGDFSQVINLDPKYATAYYNSGHVYYFRGNLDQAVAQLNQALALQPNFPLSYFIRGLIKHAQAQREDAKADFQRSAGLNFPYASFWVWISEMENNQRGVATKELTDALAKAQTFRADDWYTQIGNFLLGKVSQEDLLAKAKVGDQVDLQGRICEAYFYGGMVQRFAGDHKGADECFIKAIATDAKGSEEYVEAKRQLAEDQNQ